MDLTRGGKGSVCLDCVVHNAPGTVRTVRSTQALPSGSARPRAMKGGAGREGTMDSSCRRATRGRAPASGWAQGRGRLSPQCHARCTIVPTRGYITTRGPRLTGPRAGALGGGVRRPPGTAAGRAAAGRWRSPPASGPHIGTFPPPSRTPSPRHVRWVAVLEGGSVRGQRLDRHQARLAGRQCIARGPVSGPAFVSAMDYPGGGSA